jgi:hypothetical protein
MIRLSFECETAAQLIEQLQLTLRGVTQSVETGTAPVEDKPAPKKAAAKPKEDKPAPEKANGSGDAVPDETDLRKRATKFAAKHGPSALIQLQKDAGAPNGKISEIIGHDNRMDKLGLLLAEAQF